MLLIHPVVVGGGGGNEILRELGRLPAASCRFVTVGANVILGIIHVLYLDVGRGGASPWPSASHAWGHRTTLCTGFGITNASRNDFNEAPPHLGGKLKGVLSFHCFIRLFSPHHAPEANQRVGLDGLDTHGVDLRNLGRDRVRGSGVQGIDRGCRRRGGEGGRDTKGLGSAHHFPRAGLVSFFCKKNEGRRKMKRTCTKSSCDPTRESGSEASVFTCACVFAFSVRRG